jgi:hypothetical protein
MSTYKKLNSIGVKDKVEKKGGMDYLSWANAWDMLKQEYPDAQRVIYESPHTGLNYFTDGKTAYVKVGIIVGGQEHIDMLPVMDFRNNSLPLEKITSTDVNKSIQRSTAKAIAMHGLGIQLWIGEDTDIKDETPAPTPTPRGRRVYSSTPSKERVGLDVGDKNWDKVVAYLKANKTSMPFADLLEAFNEKYDISLNAIKSLKNEYDN